jgi:hypothetical protein
MDVAQLVSMALTAGAEAAMRGQSPAELAPAMRSLREALAQQLGGDAVAETAAEKLQTSGISPQEAEAWQAQLRVRLRSLPELDVRELRAYAEAVLTVTDPRGMAAGRYAVTAASDLPAGTSGVDIEVRTGDGGVTSLHTRWISTGTSSSFGQPVARSDFTAPTPSVAGDTVSEQAVAERERLVGSDHSETLAARANLVLARQPAGHRKEIIAVQQQMLADREQSLGLDHPDTIDARGNLAHSYRSVGRTGDAIELLEHVVADREQLFGPDHPDTLAARTILQQWRETPGSTR